MELVSKSALLVLFSTNFNVSNVQVDVRDVNQLTNAYNAILT